MTSCSVRPLCGLLALTFLTPAASALNNSIPVRLSGLTTATTVATPLLGGDNLIVDTLVTGSTGALSQSVAFTVGAGITGLTGGAAWEINTAAGNGPRLTGVNIDIFDSANALVLSDTFLGTLSGYATSSFTFGSLAAGNYTLVATGTGVRDASLDISLSFETGDAGIPAVTQPVTSGALTSATTLTQPLLATDTLFLNTLVTAQPGALSQSVAFTVGAGVTSFTGEAAWEITTAGGTGPRLVGVNIDIFDAANALVFSDTFSGTLGSFAFSALGGSLGPGSYTLIATGTAVRDASLNVSLTFAGTPVSAGVPAGDPATSALLVAGLGCLGLLRRRLARR